MSVKIPFLIDNHNHFFTYSALFNKSLNLFYCTKKEKAIELINNYDKNCNFIVANGWLDNYFNLTENEIENTRPVLIIHNSLHKFIFNKKAGEIFKQSFPEFIENKNNQNWIEKNLMRLLSFIANINKNDEKTINNAIENFHKLGICFASDMYVDNIEIIKIYEKMKLENFTEIWTNGNFYKNLSESDKKKCKGIKLFADGALGAKSAASEGFKANANPILIYSDKEITNVISELLTYKIAIAIHCIGEIAIEQVIQTLNNLKSEINSEIRLEHCQFITKQQAFRAKDLNLKLSMQVNFNMDSVIYSDRLKKEYAERNNPFRMLIDDCNFVPGKDLIFGSDGMPNGAKDALQQSLFPAIKKQKISLEEFVNGYCSENYKNYIEIDIQNKEEKINILETNFSN